jgi:MoxR-like ATPase
MELPDRSDREAIAGRVQKLSVARQMVSRALVGQEAVIDQVFTALLCAGHVLIESAPGLGKTLLVKALGTVCGMEFNRIQFTPDLMPADITGTLTLIHDDLGRASARFQPGPIFAQMVLADEINRATPKTQSALLEAMQEHTVTVAGTRYELPSPFFVLATQNPIEMEGTYVLPEAQVDRFLFKVEIPFPGQDVLEVILDATTGTRNEIVEQVLEPADILALQDLTRQVPIAPHLRAAVARFVRATQPDLPEAASRVKQYVKFGVSPRGAQTLVLAAKAHALIAGRYAVSEADLRAVAAPALRHRFQLNFDGWAEGLSADGFVSELFETELDAIA